MSKSCISAGFPEATGRLTRKDTTTRGGESCERQKQERKTKEGFEC
jgi:hypothetical protein